MTTYAADRTIVGNMDFRRVQGVRECKTEVIRGIRYGPRIPTWQPYHRTDRATMLIDTLWRMENDSQDCARELWSSDLASKSVA